MSEQNVRAWAAWKERAGVQAHFLGDQGLPTRRIEAWHYTPLQSLGKTAWGDPTSLSDDKIQAYLDGLDLPASQGRVVFANGVRVSSFSSLPKEIVDEGKPIQAGQETPALIGRFSAGLNAALRKEGLHIRVPAGVHAGLLTLVSFSEGKDVSIHLRHRIVLEEGASLTLLDVQGGYGHYLSNPQIEVVCAKGAHLRHVKHQRESKEAAHLGIVAADVAERGNYNSFTLNQGSVLARHEVVTTLQEKHAHTNVNGVQLLDGARLNDLTSMIHHAAPECTSRQTVRTVLSDSAQGVFQGKILVDQIAQKTDGYQMNQALLLSEKAQMNSKPELEIYADDVKCSHGATVGALDEEQLFYLQSRGVPGDQARDILVRAFLREAFEMLDDEELQNYLLRNVPGHD